jgi:hypothetical protein
MTLTSRDEQKLLIAAAIVVVIFLFFLAAWIKRRTGRASQGDFASLLAKGDVHAAIDEQNTSGVHDASAALQDTKLAMRTVTAVGRRVVNLLWALLSGFFCFLCVVFVLVGLTAPDGVSWGSTLMFVALAALGGWFARVQWRSFRAPVSAHLEAMENEGWLAAWRKKTDK